MEQITEQITEQVKEVGITKLIFEYKKLFEYQELIESYNNDWNRISRHRFLEENFISKYQDKVDWFFISNYQKLSESFIRKFQNKVQWHRIAMKQNLSDSFIHEFKDNEIIYMFFWEKLVTLSPVFKYKLI